MVKVSVLMPVYKTKEEYLREAISSILIDMAQGEYLAIFDHDDISMPERLEKQVAYLDTHPECGVVGCKTQRMSNGKQSKNPTRIRLFGFIPFLTIIKQANRTKVYLFEKIPLFSSKSIIKLQEK